MDRMTSFAVPSDVFDWMEQTCAQAIQPGLERMEWVLERLGHPERRCKFIHIAGTNGKGSTAAMIASVLKEAGYSTGLFVSPYVLSWRERIQVDGNSISDEAFVHWSNQLRPLAEEIRTEGPGPLTPFEFWTLVAILYFAKDAVPWFVVWETGLGGRLDSTNVCYPLVSVITEVGLDHQAWLGESLADIAQEKAGIIKAGVPVVCGAERAEVQAVIHEAAQLKNCKVYQAGRDYRIEPAEQTAETGQAFTFSNVYRRLSANVSLMGEHQLKNAGTALMTLDVLRQAYATVIEDEHIQRGLAAVYWPGRLEQVSEHPRILLDGAHNVDGVHSLVNALRDHYTYDRLVLILAMMNDKRVEDMLAPLLDVADHVITTQVADQPRSMTGCELAEVARRLHPSASVSSASSVQEALALLRAELGERDLGVIAGSLYLVSEARSLLIQAEDE
ncbi:bifunctional folylpolyglutamate synthase/dihydrofolate synthase [Laceyella sacchari]|uniref:tetrahydrofolate synthase n=1 Tax=Laceyella sacchari TaxID=37482 RepID=A0ABY5U4U6_LACSH|nr:folylpolyglutamate synthase/dihydrofolate synthase family protein [Laceyella sacchari]UWE04663.1 bifunctional folylpolyglutamate synthase/dihydrofolate synthase [Laceyella sacchari]